MTPGFDRVVDPSYTEGLEELTLDEIRSRRDDCQDLENAVSYVRRVAHGRLDIAGSEQASRATGDAAADLGELIDRLPETLADGGRAEGLPQRASSVVEPSELIVSPIVAELDAIVGPTELGSLPDRDDAALREIVSGLQAFDRDISARRRLLHDVIDALQAEIGRRYQAGEASVDSLLS
jgi:hypothetical protein